MKARLVDRDVELEKCPCAALDRDGLLERALCIEQEPDRHVAGREEARVRDSGGDPDGLVLAEVGLLGFDEIDGEIAGDRPGRRR